MTLRSRALFMLFAFLLHAGMGVMRVGADVTPQGSGQHPSCTRGCCTGMEFTACGCVENSSRPVKAPVSSLPATSSARDLVPQVAWVPLESQMLPARGAFMGQAPLAWAVPTLAPEGSTVPLTVKHCSFLH